MSIISVTEDRHSGGGSGGETDVKKYRRHWIVVTSQNMVDGYGQVVVADDGVNAIPDKWSVFTNTGWTDNDTLLIDIKAERRKEAPWIWDVIGEYKEQPGASEDPDPIDIESGHDGVRMWPVAITVAAERDLDGKAYKNSADGPFSPPLQRTERLIAVEISRRTRTFDSGDWDYLDTINDVELTEWGQATYHVLCIGVTPGERKWDEDGSYYEVKLEFRIRKTPWHPQEILDQGFYKLVDKTTGTAVIPATPLENIAPLHIADSLGIPVTKPKLLDGAGWPLEKGVDEVYLEFKEYESADFSALNLPELNVELGTTTTAP